MVALLSEKEGLRTLYRYFGQLGRVYRKDKSAIMISEGINPTYKLIKTYAESLVDLSYIYDFSWYVLYRFYTSKNSVCVSDIKSRVESALSSPERLADDYYRSTGVLILLSILDKFNALDFIDRLDEWIEELEKRNWYYIRDIQNYSIEFQAFCSVCSVTKDSNPAIQEIDSKKINEENIRLLLYYHFVQSLFHEEHTDNLKSFIEQLVNDYSGLVFDLIVDVEDIEYTAIYLYLLAKTGYQSEFEKVYPKFERMVVNNIINADWIIKAIKSARDICLGRSFNDYIIITPDEISTLHPKILYLCLIALHEAEYDKALIAPIDLKRAIQELRENKLVGVDADFVKRYDICYFANIFLILLCSALLSQILANNLAVLIGGAFIDTILLIHKYKYQKPKIFKISKDINKQ